jgi:poly(3-hydroxybutyrate) depolymerase
MLSALATAAAALAMCTGPGQPYVAGENCRVVDVDGFPRQFTVYVPERPAVPAPVVFMFHGSSGTGEQFLNISGWREQADATGLVAVFPTGLRYRVNDSGRRVTKWNSFDLSEHVDMNEKPPGYPADAPWPADDVGFTDAILADLEAQLPIDDRRIYASGFSNGSEFAARLAVERSTTIAAAGLAAGGLYEAHAPDRAVPTSLIVGTLDDRVLEQTGLAELPVDRDELMAIPEIAAVFDAHVATFGADAFRFTVLPGLHHHPNGNAISGGFEAAPEFWEFFRRHPLPPPA